MWPPLRCKTSQGHSSLPTCTQRRSTHTGIPLPGRPETLSSLAFFGTGIKLHLSLIQCPILKGLKKPNWQFLLFSYLGRPLLKISNLKGLTTNFLRSHLPSLASLVQRIDTHYKGRAVREWNKVVFLFP